MSSSHCPNRSPPSLFRTRRPFMASCSAPPPKLYSPSRATLNTWAPKSASSPYCTLGGRVSNTTPTCTASFLEVGSRRTAAAGSPAAPASFCPCACCPASSVACFSRSSGRPSTATSSGSSPNSNRSVNWRPLALTSSRCMNPNGSCTPNHLSADPDKCSPIWPVIPIGWRLAINASSPWTAATSHSSGRTTNTATASGPCSWERTSSSGVS